MRGGQGFVGVWGVVRVARGGQGWPGQGWSGVARSGAAMGSGVAVGLQRAMIMASMPERKSTIMKELTMENQWIW